MCHLMWLMFIEYDSISHIRYQFCIVKMECRITISQRWNIELQINVPGLQGGSPKRAAYTIHLPSGTSSLQN